MSVEFTSSAPPYLEARQQALTQQTSRNILDCPVDPFATTACHVPRAKPAPNRTYNQGRVIHAEGRTRIQYCTVLSVKVFRVNANLPRKVTRKSHNPRGSWRFVSAFPTAAADFRHPEQDPRPIIDAWLQVKKRQQEGWLALPCVT